MTGKTMMPDNFDEYFEKWLARKITQKEIANELKVSQSVVSNWIIQFRKDTGKDRDYIKTDAFKDALKGYEDEKLSLREAGHLLGISHTGFRISPRSTTQPPMLSLQASTTRLCR